MYFRRMVELTMMPMIVKTTNSTVNPMHSESINSIERIVSTQKTHVMTHSIRSLTVI